MKRFILIVLTAAMVLPVHGQNTSRAERRRNELQKEIEIINRQLKENAKSSTSAFISPLVVISTAESPRIALMAYRTATACFWLRPMSMSRWWK